MTFRMSRRVFAVLLLAALVAGCGGTLKEAEVGGVASYERGKGEFDREDWVDAIADLKAYVEQFPGTEKTDDALYYLGESYFNTKDYVLASGQFDRLIRDFPTTPYHPDALYMLARCDDLQSRPAPLDQTETVRAISRYRDFLSLYSDHPKAQDARKRLTMLTDRQAEKAFRNGRLYLRLKQWDAAGHYFEQVIHEYPESRWSLDARVLLADAYVKTGREAEAADTLRSVLNGTASSGTKREASKRLKKIERSTD
ncbi:MAG TPA: outer membrane protein assembly factor BamD [Candidatus Eisenbacteria bacterium]|nr:outer membrane protein assembly factor BamD [Candidatus Eisenbacteria bacterium]